MLIRRLLITGIIGLAVTLSAEAARPSRLQQKAQEKEVVGDYYTAIRMYRQDMGKSLDSARVAPGLARCYYELKDYTQALLWYGKAMENGDFAAQNNGRYLSLLMSMGSYSAVQSRVNAMGKDSIAKYKNLLLSCDSAIAWQKSDPDYIVRNVVSVNTCYSEFGAFPWQGKLLFSSDRPENTPDCYEGQDKEYIFLSPYQADVDEASDTAPRPGIAFKDVYYMDAFVNVNNAHTGPMTIMPNDSSMMFFTRSSATEGKKSRVDVGGEKHRSFVGNLGIFDTKYFDDSGWDAPQAFTQNNMRKYSVGHPCFSLDGKVMYFVSDMPGGLGGTDIWYSEKITDEEWGRPVNCGKKINTAGNEVFPTVGKDGALYFSSNGWPGMGGLDIFKAKGSKDKWSNAANMKSPINSSGDDFYLIMTDKETMRGYLSSNRSGGMGGDDIYAFHPATVPPMLAGVPLALYQGLYVTEMGIDSTADVPENAYNALEHRGLFIPTIIEDTSLLFNEEESVAAPAVEHKQPTTLVAEASLTKLNGRVYDSKTHAALPGAKICATHDNTKTSVCRESDEFGAFWFDLENNERYILSGFKDGYQSTEPLRLASSSVVEEQTLQIEMNPAVQSSFRSTHDILSRQTVTRDRSKREFRVQLLALRNDLDWSYFDRVRSTYPQFEIESSKRDGITRYTYGSFKTLAEAKRWMRRYITLGYTDTFVVLFEGGVQTQSFYSSGTSQRVL
ncbi:MAG: hypothetical protein LBK47_03935 [Prevotellaceae bacterium]|jgi:hypothetical protein|nr:hypothetical protein [Prevotellaceae bacterium]